MISRSLHLFASNIVLTSGSLLTYSPWCGLSQLCWMVPLAWILNTLMFALVLFGAANFLSCISFQLYFTGLILICDSLKSYANYLTIYPPTRGINLSMNRFKELKTWLIMLLVLLRGCNSIHRNDLFVCDVHQSIWHSLVEVISKIW